jgi:Putative transposase
MTLVLHTWTWKLELHPHVHAIITAGGLSLDGERWRCIRREFLFPVKLLGIVFRGKMLAALRRAERKGIFKRFDDFQDHQAFGRLMRAIAKVPWYVYAKPTFSRGQHVMQYLGRYTHRVGIANSRLLAVSTNSVTFRTKGAGTATLHPVEFLRRFLLHVLPDGFHKIRHFGLYSAPEKLERARILLGSKTPRPPARSWQERLLSLTGHDVTTCPSCHATLTVVPLPAIRAPPVRTTRTAWTRVACAPLSRHPDARQRRSPVSCLFSYTPHDARTRFRLLDASCQKREKSA